MRTVGDVQVPGVPVVPAAPPEFAVPAALPLPAALDAPALPGCPPPLVAPAGFPLPPWLAWPPDPFVELLLLPQPMKRATGTRNHPNSIVRVISDNLRRSMTSDEQTKKTDQLAAIGDNSPEA